MTMSHQARRAHQARVLPAHLSPLEKQQRRDVDICRRDERIRQLEGEVRFLRQRCDLLEGFARRGWAFAVGWSNRKEKL